MNAKKAKSLRKIAKQVHPNPETQYLIIRNDSETRKQFFLYKCRKAFYKYLKYTEIGKTRHYPNNIKVADAII